MNEWTSVYHSDEELAELRRQDHVLEAFQQMFDCRERGMCLLHEWMRRTGSIGNTCTCYFNLSEFLLEQDRP